MKSIKNDNDSGQFSTRVREKSRNICKKQIVFFSCCASNMI